MKIIKTFFSNDKTRKVEIYQREDMTFGFDELKFGVEEEAWFPCGRYSYAIIDTLENAIQEASTRVSWMFELNA